MADILYTRLGPELESAPVPGGTLYRTTTTSTTVNAQGMILASAVLVSITFVATPGVTP